MLPQKKKVDISSFSEQEKVLFAKYGKIPSKNKLADKLKERKYFDSGDYNMSKQGVVPHHHVGTAIPSPADIPHASPGLSTSPGGSQVLGTSPTNSNLATSPGKLSAMSYQ
ncbi:hypothetical protein T439DRAFT_323541 [Meredithblackwellia eburnea MCA 4105]